MSRKRCIRKVWKKESPIQHAINGASITHPDLLNLLHMRDLASLDALTQGRGRMAEWSDSALVARVMLQAAAYLFAQGQAVEFGPEVPRGVLK